MALKESIVITAVDQFSRVSRNFVASIKKNRHAIKKFGDNLQKAKFAFAAFAAAIVVGFTASIVSAAKFEKGITNVFTLLDKPQLEMFGGQLENAQRNAVRMGFAIEDTNKALFDTISALGAGEQANRTFNIATKLAIGGQTELRIAVDGLTSIVNAYGKDVTDATEVANAFFSAQRAGKTTVAELSASIGRVAPVAKQAGIGYKTLLATASQLTLGGLSTEEATTALRGAIAGLIKPVGDAAKVMKRAGIPVGAAALQNADFTEVLLKLAKAAKKNPDALAAMIPNIRALTAISALGEKEVGNLRKIIVSINDDIKNGTGLTEAYAKNVKTLDQIFKRILGSVKDLASEFGKELFPILKPVGLQIIKLIRAFADLSPKTKKSMLAIAGFLGAFAGAAAIIGSLLAMKVAIIALTSVIAVMALPIFALGLLAIAVGKNIAVWEDWKVVLGFISDFFDNLVTKIDNLIEKITGVQNALRKVGGFFNIKEKLREEILKGVSFDIGEQRRQMSSLEKFKPIAPEMAQLESPKFLKERAERKSIIDVNINAPKGAVSSVEANTDETVYTKLGVNLPSLLSSAGF